MSIPAEVAHQASIAALAGLTALGVSLLLTPIVRMVAVRAGWVARPVKDRWGHRVTARLGGVAIFVGFIVAAVIWVPIEVRLRSLFVGMSLVFLLGLVDDIYRMPPYTKLVGQLLTGCVVVFGGLRIEMIQWSWFAIPLSVLWFVFVMNAFNLLDNMDGLAAGIGAIAAAFCAVHAALTGAWQIAILNMILCGSCLGFLRSNFPPARIYMGDSGSHTIGMGLAALSLLGTWRHSTQLITVLAVPALVLAVPIFDTCFVTIERIAHGRHPFVGGKDHVSHRLAVLGLSVRRSVTTLYAISIWLGILSVVLVKFRFLPTLALGVLVLVAMVLVGCYLAGVRVYRLLENQPLSSGISRSTPVTLVETMLLHKRRLLEILVDFSLVSTMYVVAYLLRFEGTLSGDIQRLVVQSLPVILIIKLTCFSGFGLYRGLWRYVGLTDLISLFKAVTLGSILSAFALLYIWRFEGFSRAVFVIDWMLTFMAVGGARVSERLLDEWIHMARLRGLSVLVIGAGDTGARVLRTIRYEGGNRRVVGFLDDDAQKRGSRIHGVPILGGRENLPDIMDASRIREVLIAINDPPGELLEYVRSCCEPRGILWKVVSASVTIIP